MKYIPLSDYFVLYLILFLCGGLTIVDGEIFSSTKQKTDDDGYSALVGWMKSHGGRVDERMAIAEVDGIRGVVALDDIQEGAELLHCPWKLVIGSSSLDDQMQSEDDMCNVVKTMASEFRLGDKSMGWPYLNHIELPRLGAMWENLAVQELQGLPPSEDIHRHLEWFSRKCSNDGKDLDDAEIHALVSFISRASEVGMVPIYDLLNHHNGLKNAKLFLSEEGVNLLTVKPIQQGQQIFLSYGLKASSQMFRDYGFVESWPSLWSWKDAPTRDNHVFALFPDGVAAIHPSVEFLKEIWKSPPKVQNECLQSAIQFTRSLPPDSLIRFNTAAKNLLDGLPTTLHEDEIILKGKNVLLEKWNKNGEDQSSSALEDIIQAIQYRMSFKKAVSKALSFSEETLSGLEKEL